MVLTPIAVMDSVGVLMFFLGFLWSLWNYHKESDYTDYWLMFAVANGAAALWAATSAAEWFSFHPAAMDRVSPLIAVVAATLFGTTALRSYLSTHKQRVR